MKAVISFSKSIGSWSKEDSKQQRNSLIITIVINAIIKIVYVYVLT